MPFLELLCGLGLLLGVLTRLSAHDIALMGLSFLSPKRSWFPKVVALSVVVLGR